MWLLEFGIIAVCVPFSVYAGAIETVQHDYPASLQHRLQKLHQALETSPKTPDLLMQLAETYLDAGDDLFREPTKRIKAYQAGADFAREALDLDETQAQAHFLYAANLGHIAQLKSVLISALLIREIIDHVEQTLELAPHHAPALHMMGMILDGLPWFLGGDADQAVSYLEQAVAADPQYTHARLNLGKLYVKQGRLQSAREQFSLVIGSQSPRGAYAWSQRHHPEASRLLRQLERQD